MQTDDGSIAIIGKLTITFLVIVLLSLIFYQGLQAITAFLAVTFLAVSEISFFLSYIVMRAGVYLFDLWVSLVEKGIMDVYTLKWVVQATAVVLQLVLYSIFLVILYFALKRIAGSFKDKEQKIQRTELYFLLTPGMAGLLICVLLRTIMITVEDNVPKLLYDKYPILTVIVPAILVLSLLSVFYSVKLFQDMTALNREKSSRMILEKQIGSMQEHMAEMERVYAGINSMKHDMKNTLAVVLQLAFDIGIIMGNALDNTVEACKKLKEKKTDADAFIRLSSFWKGKMFFLEIENSFNGKLIRKGHSEFPATNKADQDAHGIGLVNIKNAAEKYHGGVDWTADNKVFTLTVMMHR